MLSLTLGVVPTPRRPGRKRTMSATAFARLAGIVVVAAACVIGAARPASAQGVGAIGGTVTDSAGAVLPGATLTLSNPRGSIGGQQEAVTGARGAYQVLPPAPRADTVQ